jgi:hypothetical protein
MLSYYVGLFVFCSAMFCIHIAIGKFGWALIAGASAALWATLAVSYMP